MGDTSLVNVESSRSLLGLPQETVKSLGGEGPLDKIGLAEDPTPHFDKVHDLRTSGIHIPLLDIGKIAHELFWDPKLVGRTFASGPGKFYVSSDQFRDPHYIHAPLQLLLIEHEGDNRITTVTQNVSDGLIRCFFEATTDPFLKTLLSALKLHDAPSDSDRRDYLALLEEAERSDSLQAELLARRTPHFLSSGVTQSSYQPGEVKVVERGECSTIASGEPTKVLGTSGAGPCIIVGIHAVTQSGAKKVASLSHIDYYMNDELETLDLMLSSIQGKLNGPIESLKVVVAGGDLSSVPELRKVLRKLKDWESQYGERCKVVLADVWNNGPPSSLTIDVESGSFAKFIPDPSAVGATSIPTKAFGR